jgi:hypothetical protein
VIALAEELARRHAEHDEEFYLLVNEADVIDLARGVVSLAVKAMARTLVDWDDMLRRNAEKPIHVRRPEPVATRPAPRRARRKRGR